MAQTEVAVERQAKQLVTLEAQTPLSQMPLILLKVEAHWMQVLAVWQVRQFEMAVEQRSQVKPLRK